MSSDAQSTIADTIWWVLPDRLAGMRKPTTEDLKHLTETGVGAIVSVLDDPSNLDLYEQAEIPHIWLPVKGGTAPSLEQVEKLQQFVDTQNLRGRGVGVHCTNGRRRTGTMLAAYLIVSGLEWEDAIKIMQTANPEAELRDAQREFLKRL